MKLTNMIRLSGAPIPCAAALAFCLFFAGQAKADCSMTRPMRAIVTAPDSVVAGGGSGMTAHTRATNPDPTANPQAAGANGSIVGLWMTNFISQGQLVDQGFDAWLADGTEILNDNPPPATGNVCL